MILRPPRSTRTAHSFPTRRSSDLVKPANRTWVLQLLWPLSYIPPWSIARYPVGYCGRRRPEACQQLMVPASSIVFAGSKDRSEEHTSELQSLMRISYAVFCLKNKKEIKQDTEIIIR